MNTLKMIETNFSSPWDNFSEYIEDYYHRKREEMRKELETIIQTEIEKLEKDIKGSKKRETKIYHTNFGTISIKRKYFIIENELICLADKLLKLPKDKWFPQTKKLACALGVNLEFRNAQELFSEVTNVKITDHGLSNLVERLGEKFYQQECSENVREVKLTDSVLTASTSKKTFLPRIYLEADGTMVPIKKEGYKEGKVGVIFCESDNLAMSKKRNYIREKEYVATMHSRDIFSDLLYKSYAQKVGNQKHELVIIGDGAKWIWEMADYYYPNAIQILDFYHVSEYVWDVAKAAYPESKSKQKKWAEYQLNLLKDSKWKLININKFKKSTPELIEAIININRYLSNNKVRIDYKKYQKQGLMIGSGVVESSNRKVVTQRLKQAGMFWSKYGANSVMALRACYLSSSDKWQNIWISNTA